MAEGIVEPLSAGTLEGSESGGMMAEGLDVRAESSLVFQVEFPELNAAAMMRSCGNGVRLCLDSGWLLVRWEEQRW